MLRLQALTLIHRIGELTKGIAMLTANDEELKTFHQPWLTAVRPRQRRDLNGIVGDEGGLNQGFFHGLLKGLIQQTTHRIGQGRGLQPLGFHGGGGFAAATEAREIKSGGFLHQFMHGGPAPTRGQIDFGALVSDLGAAADLLGHRADQLLGEIHHVVVISEGLIDLH